MGVARRAPKPPSPKSEWTTYKKGGEWWSIRLYPAGFDIGYETRGVRRFEFHKPPEAEAEPRYDAYVARWIAEGFVKLTPAEEALLPTQTTGVSAYIDWIGPFPDDASYYRHRNLIYATFARGDAAVTTTGQIGRCFGELERHYYGIYAKNVLETYDDEPAYKPLDRAAVIALYAQAKKAKKAKKATKKKAKK